MAKDVSDMIGTAIGTAAREAIQSVSKGARRRSRGTAIGPKEVAAGAAGLGLMALAPLAAKGANKLASGAVAKGGEQLKGAGDAVGDKLRGDVMDAIPGHGLFSS